MIIKNNKKCNIKINDRNIEPCEYCCGRNANNIYYEDLHIRTSYLKIVENFLYSYDIKNEQINNVEINYCPMCGRKLNDKK